MKQLLEQYKIKKDKLIQEAIDDNDLPLLKKIIRIEIALVMYDLFRKKGIWT